MDLVQLIEASRVLEIMGLLLALAALIFVLFAMYLVGRELVKHMPEWVAARSIRTNATLASRPNTWTEILNRREYLGIADWFIARFTLLGVFGVLAVGCAAWLQQKNFAFGMRVLALSILFGGACLVGGWLFGLLFGVPKTVTQLDTSNPPSPPPPPPPRPLLEPEMRQRPLAARPARQAVLPRRLRRQLPRRPIASAGGRVASIRTSPTYLTG